MEYEYLQGGRLHSLSGPTVPVIDNPLLIKLKIIFGVCSDGTLCVLICTYSLLSMDTIEKSLVYSFSFPLISYLYTLIRSF